MKTNGKGLSAKILAALVVFLAAACSFNYDTASQNDDEANLVMETVEYTRIVNGNPEIRVTAREVRRYETKHVMEMDDFSFEQYNAAPAGARDHAVNARGRAEKAVMETDTNNFFMGGGVNIEVISESIIIETEDVSWRDAERTLKAPGTVYITRSDGTTLTGTGFSADLSVRSWEFESAVEGSIVEDD